MIARKKPLQRSAKPIQRKRAKARTYKTPRCDVRGCKKPREVKWAAMPPEWSDWMPANRAEIDKAMEGTTLPVLNLQGEVVSTMVMDGPWHGMCRSHAKAESDRRFSLFIRARDGECRIKTETPCVGPLQCCHLLSRRFHATRWDEGNAVAGCAGHHSYWTRNPDRWAQWLDENKTVELALLRERAFNGAPMDVADVLVRYPAASKKEGVE